MAKEEGEIKTILQKELPDFPDEDVLDYMAGMLADEGVDKEDLEDSLCEFLDEYASDEVTARKSIQKILNLVFENASVDNEGTKRQEGEPTKLASAVIMAKLAREHSDAVDKEMEHIIGRTDVNSNADMVQFFDEDDNVQTEEELLAAARAKKKNKRLEKRRLARERRVAPIRNALVEKLTQEPVVIHGMIGEDGQYGSNPCVDIVLEDVNVDLAGISLIEDANLTLVYGRRYGLIGRNGSGKTTFLKFLASKMFEGVPWYVQILHIAQEITGNDKSALQTLLDTDVERTALLREMNALGGGEEETDLASDQELLEAFGLDTSIKNTGERLVEIYDRLDEIEADRQEGRASNILAGLSFTPDMMKLPTSELSGGWRMRVSLARALFIEPDMLLLDEPTNHLDLHAVVWLENYLRGYQNTVIVVSHARDFLNEVVTDVVELSGKKMKRYKGNYDTFEQTKSEAHLRDQRTQDRNEKERAEIQKFINKNIGGGAKAANMAKSRQKMLDKINVVEKTHSKESLVNFRIPNPGPVAGGWGIRLVGVGFGYPGKPELFSGVEFSINQNSRICLVGPNGIGKTTLLNVIYQELEPTKGMVTKNQRLRVGRFSQHHVDSLDMKVSILEQMQHDYPDHPPQKIRKHLGAMGVTGELQIRPIYTLSGGQKSRIALSMITYSEPHLLLLDEPTNHLDLHTVQGLIRALANFEGGVLVVSHDEHLITAVCDELWIIKDKKVVQSTEDFQAYKNSILQSFENAAEHPAAQQYSHPATQNA
eukprot:m.82564 g.82564  ORF g.82564 m.82564 type:complete len:768 (-) comp12875_c0_seq1:39-2342(-)